MNIQQCPTLVLISLSSQDHLGVLCTSLTFVYSTSLSQERLNMKYNYHPGQAQGHRQLTRLSCPMVSWTGTDPTPLLLCLTGIQCPHTWKETKILRSPCGSGTAAVMAAREARGILKLGEEFLHDSILGTRFRGRLLRETKVENIFSLASSYVFFPSFGILPNEI